jgi:hypothetical protein
MIGFLLVCVVYNAHKFTSLIHDPIALKEKLGVFHHTSPSFIITLNTFKEHSSILILTFMAIGLMLSIL